jgi:hypothetical protein
MIPYRVLIDSNLIGDNPKDKYENLIKMKEILSQIAYPRRGTCEEDFTLYDFANRIMAIFNADDLEVQYD